MYIADTSILPFAIRVSITSLCPIVPAIMTLPDSSGALVTTFAGFPVTSSTSLAKVSAIIFRPQYSLPSPSLISSCSASTYTVAWFCWLASRKLSVFPRTSPPAFFAVTGLDAFDSFRINIFSIVAKIVRMRNKAIAFLFILLLLSICWCYNVSLHL